MASNTRDLVVRIIGDARQMKQATKEAETGLGAFESRVGKIGSALAGVFAGGALLAFGKQAAQAALEDQRAQERLAKTLENVTGATKAQVAAVEDYISKTESQYAVIDDELRPAFETLVRATKDTAQAQQMLQLALDVSAGSGKSLQEVSTALVKAMGGQMRSLKDLGIQVKTTSGDTASFTDVQAQLNAMFSGQAAEAANSQTGEMRKLQIQYENLKESIGRALLPVMIQLADAANAVFGWFNSLDQGTQKLIVQVAMFGAAAFAAVKAFNALRTAVVAMKVAAIESQAGIAGLAGGLGTITPLIGAAALAYMIFANRQKEAVVSTYNLTDALNDQSTSLTDDIAKTIAGIPDVSNLLRKAGITAGDAADYITGKWDGMGRGLKSNTEMVILFQEHLTPLRRELIRWAQDTATSTAITNDAAHATGKQAEAIANLELPLNSSQRSMQEWVKRQQLAARESEEWSKKTIAAYDAVFQHLQGLVDNGRLLDDVRDKMKTYREEVEKHGAKSRDAMRAQNDYVLSLASAAAGAAAAVPGFAKLNEAQKKVEESKFIKNWAQNLQKTIEPGSPLWIALQQMINLISGLTGGSSSSDMIGSIQLPDSITDRLPKRRRAAGGPVAAGMAYTVGERGPETFVPATGGTILPYGAGAGGAVFHINITAGMGADGQSIGNQIVSALKAYVRSNGKIAGIAA